MFGFGFSKSNVALPSLVLETQSQTVFGLTVWVRLSKTKLGITAFGFGEPKSNTRLFFVVFIEVVFVDRCFSGRSFGGPTTVGAPQCC